MAQNRCKPRQFFGARLCSTSRSKAAIPTRFGWVFDHSRGPFWLRLCRAAQYPDLKLTRPAAGRKDRFVPSSEETRSSIKHPFERKETLCFIDRNGLGVRWRLAEMECVMAVSAARHRGGGGPLDRPPPVNALAIDTIAGLGFPPLEANEFPA